MIIGLTGTIGAGKGAIVDYLKQKGFIHYSSRALITKEIEKRALPADRSSMRNVANEMRATHGPTYIIETHYNRAREAGGNAVIESVRAIKEAEFLQSRGVYLLAVDTADRRVRYERAMKRASETDQVDFDTWVTQEEREWHNKADHDMNVPAVMAMADYTIHNDGTLAELHAQIDAVLAKLQK